MAQQISDRVIKLDVDRATFSEQVARIKGQLTGMADESDKVQARMQRAADRQSAALKSVGDAGAAGAADMKARQSAATEGLNKDWQSVSKSVDETHRRVTELNQRMRENDGQVAALARRQDELAASFFRQIDGVRQLNSETQSLANVQARFRAARAAEVDKAMAELSTTVQAQIEDVTATLEDKLTAVVDADGATAIYTLKAGVRINDVMYNAGMSIAVLAEAGKPVVTRVGFNANQFVLMSGSGDTQYSPFAVVNGQVFISSAFIQDGTITNAKIGARYG